MWRRSAQPGEHCPCLRRGAVAADGDAAHLYRDSDVLRPQAAHHMCHVYYARSLGPLRYMPQAAPLAYAVITLSKQQLATSRCKQIIIMLNKQQEQG